jgi:hypothetical protein
MMDLREFIYQAENARRARRLLLAVRFVVLLAIVLLLLVGAVWVW